MIVVHLRFMQYILTHIKQHASSLSIKKQLKILQSTLKMKLLVILQFEAPRYVKMRMFHVDEPLINEHYIQ